LSSPCPTGSRIIIFPDFYFVIYTFHYFWLTHNNLHDYGIQCDISISALVCCYLLCPANILCYNQYTKLWGNMPKYLE
jgi:hypothetical protein